MGCEQRRPTCVTCQIKQPSGCCIAHPDDAEFWAGGTVARWTDAETEVTYCVLSDGAAGGFDPAIPRSEIPQARRAEQAEGGALLGVHDVRFFGLGDARADSGQHGGRWLAGRTARGGVPGGRDWLARFGFASPRPPRGEQLAGLVEKPASRGGTQRRQGRDQRCDLAEHMARVQVPGLVNDPFLL